MFTSELYVLLMHEAYMVKYCVVNNADDDYINDLV